jgi:hypothetical protein
LDDVFISCASEDEPIAYRIAEALKAQGVSVRIDGDELLPGVNWHAKLSNQIENAHNFLLIVSKSSATSKWLDFKIATAVAAHSYDPRKRIIPVLVDRGVRLPSFIDQYVAADLSDQSDFEHEIAKLVTSIKADRAAIAQVPDLDGMMQNVDVMRLRLAHKETLHRINMEERDAKLRMGGIAAVAILGFVALGALSLAAYSGSIYAFRAVAIISLLTGFMSGGIGYFFGRKMELVSTYIKRNSTESPKQSSEGEK